MAYYLLSTYRSLGKNKKSKPKLNLIKKYEQLKLIVHPQDSESIKILDLLCGCGFDLYEYPSNRSNASLSLVIHHPIDEDRKKKK